MDRKRLGVQQFEPVITEEKLFNMKNFPLAFLLGIIGIILFVVLARLFELDFAYSLLLVLVIVGIYSTILFFLLEPTILKRVHTKEIQTYEKPIIREVIKEVEKPIIHEVIKKVEKPIIREVIRNIFVETPRKKLNIPAYKYRGSSATKTYHKTSCRLSKLIKNKYKISRNDIAYFKKNKFKPCKVCKPNKS